MSAYLFYSPRFRPLSADGGILPGAYIQFYETGTTTPTDTYANEDLSTANANPVVANAAGEFAAIYLDPAVTYRAQLYDADDTLQWDIDPLAPPRDVPPGTVVWFHGDSTARDAAYPPALYQILNGSNGAPDGRDRFPIIAGGTYASGDDGGSAGATTSSDGAHDHDEATGSTTLTENQIPAHRHGLRFSAGAANIVIYNSGAAEGLGAFDGTGVDDVENLGGGDDVMQEAGGGTGHTHTIASDGAHTHTVTANPPYIALWALMRRA